MLSKHQIKVIKSLAQKKYRHELGLFLVEGIKSITEFLESDYELDGLYTTQPIFESHASKTVTISEKDLMRISQLKNPNTALAVFKIPNHTDVKYNGLTLALDAVRDPGNLGTIIRLCDWFGVQSILCSTTTVDCYNPKVVQATMGSLTRVSVNYIDLEAYLKHASTTISGTFMDGDTIYTEDLPKEGVVVLGNEANGISESIESLVNRRLSIPQFGNSKPTESLNVANATAIVLSEFLRRTIET